MSQTLARYSPLEEVLHASTHGVGILLSIAGLAVLVAFAAMNGNGWHVTSASIYGATLVLMYSASTLYHGVWHQRAKALLRRFDHAAIFLLIAGTYTPFMLVNLREQGGWILFAVIWALAVAGVILEFTGWRPFKRISLGVYLGMGWLVVFALEPLVEQVSTGGLVLLVAGGLAYTLGAVFYVRESMKYHHAIWHLFVLAGSILHYFSVLFYVIP
jgi:hemolysin III